MKSFDIEDTITKLNQISTKRAEVLLDHQVKSIKDLLYYFPRKHLDRTNITKIKNIAPAHKYNIVGTVETLGEKRTRFKKIYQILISDGTGVLTLTWFNSSKYIKNLVKKGDLIAVHGKVDWYNGFSISHPEFDILDQKTDPANTGSIIPIYPLTNEFKRVGIEQRLIRKLILQSLDKISSFNEMYDDKILKFHKLVKIEEALSQLHFPDDINQLKSLSLIHI